GVSCLPFARDPCPGVDCRLLPETPPGVGCPCCPRPLPRGRLPVCCPRPLPRGRLPLVARDPCPGVGCPPVVRLL
ncbi:unnamed protein product, partial [Staurois parvus]